MLPFSDVSAYYHHMTMLNTSALSTPKRYKIAREVAGLSQGELAALVGVNRTTVGDWEAGRTEPAFSKLVALARATEQPLDWFAEGLSADVVRPKGLEPLTFWSVVNEDDSTFWTADRKSAYASIVRQDALDFVFDRILGGL